MNNSGLIYTEIKTCRTGIQTQTLKSSLLTIILYASTNNNKSWQQQMNSNETF